MRHAFERGQGVALTQGPKVPTWSQVNVALDKLTKNDKMLLNSARSLGLTVPPWGLLIIAFGLVSSYQI